MSKVIRNKNCILGAKPRIIIITSLILLSAISLDVLGAEAAETNDLFNMSLEQLMDVGVYAAATITEKNPLKTPACVTTITAEDIARTPARNIMDLMEIYVPGMLYMNHSIGPVMGMRGIIADRPYKFLVNVNGINVNIKSHYGARLELLNWELSDIDRIEIIRGPGSVTYGPGAIGGVINIYTKTGKKAPGLEFGGSYWGKYDSVGNYVSYGRVKDDFQLYSYFSVTSTDGISPDLFGTDAYKTTLGGRRSGYVGKDGLWGNAPPTTYMGDYFNQPQIKAHLDIQFNDNWRFWGRYVTESSSVMHSGATQYMIDGKYQDARLESYRYFQLALENKRDISDNWNLKSTFGLSSIDVRDIQGKNTTTDLDGAPGGSYEAPGYNYIRPGLDHDLRNYGWIYSEWEYFARFMLNYEPKDSKLKAALGLELSYDLIRPSWGRNADNGLRLSDGIMSGPTSEACGTGTGQIPSTDTKYYAVGEGWETYMYSLIGELNYQFTPKTTMIVSGRFDVHSYTTGMFSPRFALIHELKKDHYLKFIAQKSVRMNTQEELYMNHINRTTNIPETLETLELIYSGKMTEHLSLETSVFFNRNEAIAWNSTLRSSAPLGTLKTIGMEIDLKYKKENFELGINHSLVKQLSWELAGGITNSGISYSDYTRTVNPGGVIIRSNGNDLANWANQATKLYTNIDLLEKKLTLHGDIRVLWGFEGLEDGLNALADAGGNASSIQAVRDKDAYGVLSTANVSLTYHVNKSADFMVFVQNIPIIGDNKRYSYSSGYAYSDTRDKSSWVEEPMVVGFTYKIRF
jgi:outer membrane receptor protein involved in Fe transport